MKQIDMVEYTGYRLVKSEDLNHHHSLFAGRGMSWLIEAGFVAAASICEPEYIRFIHSSEMSFKSPVHLGEVLKFSSRVVLVGNSSLTVYVKMSVKDENCGDGFLTFVHVKPKPKRHRDEPSIWSTAQIGVDVIPVTEEDKMLQEHAILLKNNRLKNK